MADPKGTLSYADLKAEVDRLTAALADQTAVATEAPNFLT